MRENSCGLVQGNFDGTVTLDISQECHSTPSVPQEDIEKHEIKRSDYDPHLDPLFRTALRWAQKYDEVLSDLALIPVSPEAVLIIRRVSDRPAQVRFWPFKPHKDPTLHLVLGTSFRLASVKAKGYDQADKASRFPLGEEQDWLMLLGKDISVTALKNAIKNVTRILTGTDRKILIQRPEHANGTAVEDKVFHQQLKSEAPPPITK